VARKHVNATKIWNSTDDTAAKSSTPLDERVPDPFVRPKVKLCDD